MSEQQTSPPAKKRAYKSWLVGFLLLIVLAAVAWWYFIGRGEGLLRGVASGEVVPDAPGAREGGIAVLERRLATLETAVLALEARAQTHDSALAALSEFARQDDVQESTSRLYAEIRAVRESYPKALEIERSQAALALRLLELAEIEHRLFGDTGAVVSLVNRAQALLREHPLAMDLRVDLTRLSEDIAASTSGGLLEIFNALQTLTEQAAGVPLAKSQFEVVAEESVGFLDRVATGLSSLVRISRLDTPDEGEVSRVQLVLAFERMQVAVLRRDEVAFERERALAHDWLWRHAQVEDTLARTLLTGLEALEGTHLGVQRQEFADLIGRVREIVE